jgi:hypothetical protein
MHVWKLAACWGTLFQLAVFPLYWINMYSHGEVAEKVGWMASKKAAHGQTAEVQCDRNRDLYMITGLARK